MINDNSIAVNEKKKRIDGVKIGDAKRDDKNHVNFKMKIIIWQSMRIIIILGCQTKIKSFRLRSGFAQEFIDF